MGGDKTNNVKLNHTLKVIANIFHEENINDWFIFFGTLLGIVRENSCIQGDDDLDIMINEDDYQQIRNAFEKRGHEFIPYREAAPHRPFKKMLLKSKPTEEFCTFDLYVCNVNYNGTFYSPWEGTAIRHPYIDVEKKILVKKDWNGTLLNLPFNFEKKLEHMYGDWRVPQSRRKSKRENDIP